MMMPTMPVSDQAVAEMLRGALPKAIQTLREIMDDPTKPKSLRDRAATILLPHLRRLNLDRLRLVVLRAEISRLQAEHDQLQEEYDRYFELAGLGTTAT